MCIFPPQLNKDLLHAYYVLDSISSHRECFIEISSSTSCSIDESSQATKQEKNTK